MPLSYLKVILAWVISHMVTYLWHTARLLWVCELWPHVFQGPKECGKIQTLGKGDGQKTDHN